MIPCDSDLNDLPDLLEEDGDLLDGEGEGTGGNPSETMHFPGDDDSHQYFSTEEEAAQSVKLYAHSEGFDVIYCRSRTNSGGVKTKTLRCDRGGTPQANTKKSKRCGCQWRIIIYKEENECWKVPP